MCHAERINVFCRSRLGVRGVPASSEHDASGSDLVGSVLFHVVLAWHWQSGAYRIYDTDYS